MSITVVSLNPSIDWQLTTQDFVYGGLNRVEMGGRYASGKGINVAVALKNLGLDPLCTGFNYRDNGEFVAGALDDHGVRHDFVMADGAVRVNIKLHDAAGTMTELNQPGCHVSDTALFEFNEKMMTTAKKASLLHRRKSLARGPFLVLSGSLPAGVPVDIYRRLCVVWPGVVVLDAEGEALKQALAGSSPPYCIKPNLFELESCFGVKLSSVDKIAAFCRDLLREYGIGVICVSLGADGAVLVTASAALYMPGLDLDVRGVQGAGDAMVAGLVYGLYSGAAEAELLCMASAAAAASVEREGTLMCTGADFKRFLAGMPMPVLL